MVAFFGTRVSRLEIASVCHIIPIYTVIGISLFNLTTVDAKVHDGRLRIALLSSCLGYMLLNPKIHYLKKKEFLRDISQQYLDEDIPRQ